MRAGQVLFEASAPPNAGATHPLRGPPNLARTVRTRRGGAIPGLRYRPAAPADPEKVKEVDRMRSRSPPGPHPPVPRAVHHALTGMDLIRERPEVTPR
ncbi:hypothetical protein GCM10009753_51450 [Streptantibioticus ferralitis]